MTRGAWSVSEPPSYQEFADQLKVADAFASQDPKRSFELLELGIGQLNELLRPRRS